ncbi:hypothetical protein [Sulfuriflexus mobilis]|uniref:hypothetical protein n=1 Tax=Sulfuriflexus mobilis TaxID=1811807 RepID=UPI000F81C2E0|nr:hypothetical protein [Sulfuriflexus mobilis]
MSKDKQNTKPTEDSGVANDAAVMEQVTEQRAAKKQGSYLGGLLLVAILIGTAVAAWYYQSMWLPQAQQWWAGLMPAQEQGDPMAAPRPRGIETGQASTKQESSGYVLSAITEEKPAEQMPEGAKADVPVMLAKTAPPRPAPTLSTQVEEASAPVVPSGGDAVPVTNNDYAASMAPVAVIPSAAGTQDRIRTASLAQARQAFWARDLTAAENLYHELLKREPTATDAWGELGNLYYGQAKWQQAAKAYAEAAMQLLDQGQYSQAMFLHYVVRGLDSAQAMRIDEKMRAMQAAPRG